MNWKAFLLTLAHASVGAAVPAALATALPAIGAGLANAHIDPVTGAIVGSILSSLASAFSAPPTAK